MCMLIRLAARYKCLFVEATGCRMLKPFDVLARM